MPKKGSLTVKNVTDVSSKQWDAIIKNGLSTQQKIIANEIAYMGINNKSLKEISQENNIPLSTLYRWRSHPVFNNEVNKIANELQRSHLVNVHNRLLQCLNSNNDKTLLKAIELYYKQQGLLKDVTENTNKTETKLTLESVLNEII